MFWDRRAQGLRKVASSYEPPLKFCPEPSRNYVVRRHGIGCDDADRLGSQKNDTAAQDRRRAAVSGLARDRDRASHPAAMACIRRRAERRDAVRSAQRPLHHRRRQARDRSDIRRRNSAIMAGHWVLLGFGMFVVEEKASGKFVGRVGPFFPPGWAGFEVGWGIAKEFRGKGYAV